MWHFGLSTYIIISYEKDMYQNLIFMWVLVKLLKRKEEKKIWKTCNVHIFELELLLNFMKALLSLKQKN